MKRTVVLPQQALLTNLYISVEEKEGGGFWPNFNLTTGHMLTECSRAVKSNVHVVMETTAMAQPWIQWQHPLSLHF